jgi:anti-sigma regulatory factor (Ser/Thr protein kinase)
LTVRRLRNAVGAFAADGGITGIRLEEIRACVSEAVTNAVVHAFRDGREPGTIVARAELGPSALEVVICDDGIGFAPRSDSPGLGLGMPTIAALATSIALSVPAGGGTELRMVFAI